MWSDRSRDIHQAMTAMTAMAMALEAAMVTEDLIGMVAVATTIEVEETTGMVEGTMHVGRRMLGMN